VEFVDAVLVRLGDPAERAAVFDQVALANLVEAAYDTEAMPVGPPFAAVFDDLTLGFAATPGAVLDGSWMGSGGLDRTEFRAQLHGLGEPAPRIDALWRGSLVVRTATARDTVEALEMRLPSLNVDPQIVADLGGLPGDPVLLETERRTRVLTRLRAGLHQPAAFTDAQLDRLLDRAGAASVSELVALAQQAVPATVQLRFSPPPAAAPAPKALPFAATVFVRGAGFSLAALLAESRLARARAEDLGLDVPAPAEIRRRHRMVVVWVVPAVMFDDPDWPGGGNGPPTQQRAARLARAGRWLAAQGIGLAAVD
jgi:hypothetical protein